MKVADTEIATGEVVKELNGSTVGDEYGKEGAQPNRQACGQPRAHASDDAWHEPGKARRCARFDISAGPEIRKGHQPDRRKPTSADLAYPPGAGLVLF